MCVSCRPIQREESDPSKTQLQDCINKLQKTSKIIQETTKPKQTLNELKDQKLQGPFSTDKTKTRLEICRNELKEYTNTPKILKKVLNSSKRVPQTETTNLRTITKLPTKNEFAISNLSLSGLDDEINQRPSMSPNSSASQTLVPEQKSTPSPDSNKTHVNSNKNSSLRTSTAQKCRNGRISLAELQELATAQQQQIAEQESLLKSKELKVGELQADHKLKEQFISQKTERLRNLKQRVSEQDETLLKMSMMDQHLDEQKKHVSSLADKMLAVRTALDQRSLEATSASDQLTALTRCLEALRVRERALTGSRTRNTERELVQQLENWERVGAQQVKSVSVLKGAVKQRKAVINSINERISQLEERLLRKTQQNRLKTCPQTVQPIPTTSSIEPSPRLCGNIPRTESHQLNALEFKEGNIKFEECTRPDDNMITCPIGSVSQRNLDTNSKITAGKKSCKHHRKDQEKSSIKNQKEQVREGSKRIDQREKNKPDCYKHSFNNSKMTKMQDSMIFSSTNLINQKIRTTKHISNISCNKIEPRINNKNNVT